MTIPIALQLYTVREALAQDFAGVMKKIADIGYVGVEPAFGALGATPAQAARRFRDLGLETPSAHAPLPVGPDKHKALDFATAFGCKYIISGKGPDNYQTADMVRQTCDLFNQAQAAAAERGMTLGMHNHWWEFQQVEGRYIYHMMLEHLDPAVFFQIDTYWVQAAGLDPAQVARELGPRVLLLHIKDGPAVMDAPQVAAGDGVLDFPGIVRAAEGAAEWLVVELDHCATDMLEAVEKSYRYLVGNGLARGRKELRRP